MFPLYLVLPCIAANGGDLSPDLGIFCSAGHLGEHQGQSYGVVTRLCVLGNCWGIVKYKLIDGCAGDYFSIMTCINIYSFSVSNYGTNDNSDL